MCQQEHIKMGKALASLRDEARFAPPDACVVVRGLICDVHVLAGSAAGWQRVCDAQLPGQGASQLPCEFYFGAHGISFLEVWFASDAGTALWMQPAPSKAFCAALQDTLTALTPEKREVSIPSQCVRWCALLVRLFRWQP
jgi:hypothetical protein